MITSLDLICTVEAIAQKSVLTKSERGYFCLELR